MTRAELMREALTAVRRALRAVGRALGPRETLSQRIQRERREVGW